MRYSEEAIRENIEKIIGADTDAMTMALLIMQSAYDLHNNILINSLCKIAENALNINNLGDRWEKKNPGTGAEEGFFWIEEIFLKKDRRFTVILAIKGDKLCIDWCMGCDDASKQEDAHQKLRAWFSEERHMENPLAQSDGSAFWRYFPYADGEFSKKNALHIVELAMGAGIYPDKSSFGLTPLDIAEKLYEACEDFEHVLRNKGSALQS